MSNKGRSPFDVQPTAEPIVTRKQPETKPTGVETTKQEKQKDQVFETEYTGGGGLLDKMKLFFSERGVRGQKEKVTNLKREVKTADSQIKKLEDARRKAESAIRELEDSLTGEEGKKLEAAGFNVASLQPDSLQTELSDIDDQIEELRNESTAFKEELETEEEKISTYTEKRDAIADRIIGRYNEKLKPIEENLTELKEEKANIDLEIALLRTEHKEPTTILNNLEKQKNQLEKSLRAAGIEEIDIKNNETLKNLNDMIRQGRKKMRVEMARLDKEKQKIGKKIAKAEKKANSYKNKRREYIRIRGGEQKKENISGTKEIRDVKENKIRLPIKSYIKDWNDYSENLEINEDDFINTISSIRESKGWENREVNLEEFIDILRNYSKIPSKPITLSEKDLSDFRTYFNQPKA